MKIFFANTVQYIEHLLPLFNAFKEEDKIFLAPKELKSNLPTQNTLLYSQERDLITYIKDLVSKDKNTLCVVASYGSVRRLSKKDYPVLQFILLEHGAGQIYQSEVPGWARGSFRHSNRIKLFLGTNKFCVEAFKKNNNDITSYIVGCPKLDNIETQINDYNNPLVVFSWHWDCDSIPETRSGFNFWAEEVLTLHKDKDKKFRIAIHGHPRLQDQTKAFCMKHQIDFIKTFDYVLKYANIYVVDNSSTLYEFAATTKPVILLNNPFYRRDVEHGMRFWEHVDLGLNCDRRGEIRPLIDFIIKNKGDTLCNERKKAIIDEVYPYRGQSTLKCINIINSSNIIIRQ